MRCQRHSRPPDTDSPGPVDSSVQRCISRLRIPPQPIRQEIILGRHRRNHCCCQREIDRDEMFPGKPCVILSQPSRAALGQVKHICGKCPEHACLKHYVSKTGVDGAALVDLQKCSCRKGIDDRCQLGKQSNDVECVMASAWCEQNGSLSSPDGSSESSRAKLVTYCPPWSFDPISSDNDAFSHSAGATSSSCEFCQDDVTGGKRSLCGHLTDEQNVSSPPEQNESSGQQRQYDSPWDRICGQIGGMQIKDSPVSYDGAWDCPSSSAVTHHPGSDGSTVELLNQTMDTNTSVCDSSTSIDDSILQDCKFTQQKQIDGIPSWWHGDITRQQARDLLSTAGRQPGDYLVRTSQSGGHSLSMLTANNDVVHLKISHNPRKLHPTGFSAGGKIAMRQYILGMCSKPFNSISSIISYYSTHPVPIRGSSSYICLRRPVLANHNEH